jgi:hypothetical protein
MIRVDEQRAKAGRREAFGDGDGVRGLGDAAFEIHEQQDRHGQPRRFPQIEEPSIEDRAASTASFDPRLCIVKSRASFFVNALTSDDAIRTSQAEPFAVRGVW